MKKVILLATIALLAAAAHAADEFVTDELLVAFKPGTPGAVADGIRNGQGASSIKAWPRINAEHWHLAPGRGVAQAIQALSANPNVLYADPNYIVHAVEIPSDPLRGELWGMHNFGQTGGLADADTDALEAWQLPPGAGPVVVGVIDSGIDYLHEDLAGKIWSNPNEIPGNGIDDDGNGYVDDVTGWDFVNNDNNPMDDHGHGTHVSGTIAAQGNNGIGVIGLAGLNPNVMLMPLKFLNASGSGTTAAAVDAVLYAASFQDGSGNKVVRITSNSWGGGPKSRSLEDAIKHSAALFVAAAGNSGSSTPMYPAAYAQPNVISVAATDANDALASFSNYGASVHLAAPGVNILSTKPNDTYAFSSGTSMAAPHVSGVAALIMSQTPAFSVADTKAQLLNHVDILPALAGKVTTSGRLNARKALGAAELPSDTTAPASVADLAASPASPHSVTLVWTAPGDDDSLGTAYLYDLRYSRNPINTDTDFAAAAQVGAEPGPQAAGAAETFTVGNLTDNVTWYFALKTMDEAGNLSALSNLTSATTPIADWRYLRVGGGQNVGNYASLGVTAEGLWAVAYDDSAAGVLKCAIYPGGPGFTIETVASGGVGPSLAYSAGGDVSVSHVSGTKLLFAIKSGASWTSTQLESKDVYPGETSLVYDGLARPWITYRKTGRSSGLWSALRNGSSWSTQLIDPKAYAVYHQIAIDSAGNPAIAYSHDSNVDGAVDTLKFAQWNGGAWAISVVDAGGWYATLAHDPTTGYPAVAHWNATTGQLRFLRWNGTAWTTAEIVDTASSITGCSLAFGPDGKAYVAYGATEMRLAQRDPNSGVWTAQVMDASTTGSLRNSLKGRPLLTPTGVAYRGPAQMGYASTVQLAIRQTPY